MAVGLLLAVTWAAVLPAFQAPDEQSQVNWLNIFYAAEWAVFAGFAFYLWYRLARDAWERELEDFEDGDEPEPGARPAAS